MNKRKSDAYKILTPKDTRIFGKIEKATVTVNATYRLVNNSDKEQSITARKITDKILVAKNNK